MQSDGIGLLCMLAQDGHVGFAEFAHETEQGQSGLAVHEACVGRPHP